MLSTIFPFSGHTIDSHSILSPETRQPPSFFVYKTVFVVMLGVLLGFRPEQKKWMKAQE